MSHVIKFVHEMVLQCLRVAVRFWGAYRRRLSYLVIAYLWIRQACARGSLVGSGECVVSLTSYGTRVSRVHWTIWSMALGRERPKRIILWIDDEKLLASPGRHLERLIARGLEINRCENLGPHKKYYPYISSLSDRQSPLVTADDDVLYSRNWLSSLLNSFERFPDMIHCQRARRVIENNGRVAPYADWPFAASSSPSYSIMPTGVSGVLYPVSFQHEVLLRGEKFRTCAPMADDLWLYGIARASGTMVVQVSSHPREYLEIPGSQTNGLWRSNVLMGDNDKQLQAVLRALELPVM